MADFWLVDPGTQNLVSPYQSHPKAKPIQAAQPFSVRVLSLVVTQDLDGFLRGKNDLLVLTRASLGDQPLVERVHLFEEEVDKGEPISNLFADLMYACEDYSGHDRLWLELNVLEIDSDSGERKAAVRAFEAMAATAGAVFPAVLPYTAVAASVVKVAEKLVSALEDDEHVVRVPVAFHPGPARPGRAPFQSGAFVAFSSPIGDPTGYRLEDDGLVTRDGAATDRSFIAFDVEPSASPRPDFVVNQKVATLLTQIRDKNENTIRTTFDFVSDTLTSYSNYRKLERYLQLKKKGDDATREEKALMRQIAKIDDLKPFLPK